MSKKKAPVKGPEVSEVFGTVYQNDGNVCVILGADRNMYRYEYPPRSFYAELEIGAFVKIYFTPAGLDPVIVAIEEVN